jgi:hypothetical protein
MNWSRELVKEEDCSWPVHQTHIINVLDAALEANEEVPKMEVVTERLLHEERKMNNRSIDSVTVGVSNGCQVSRVCYYCKKIGHIKAIL